MTQIFRVKKHIRDEPPPPLHRGRYERRYGGVPGGVMGGMRGKYEGEVWEGYEGEGRGQRYGVGYRKGMKGEVWGGGMGWGMGGGHPISKVTQPGLRCTYQQFSSDHRKGYLRANS